MHPRLCLQNLPATLNQRVQYQARNQTIAMLNMHAKHTKRTRAFGVSAGEDDVESYQRKANITFALDSGGLAAR
jgi:hypothetical protein